uniref:Coiled-coil domain-containing protein 117-like protein n=1 Tax=Callorhinchus milii TaxID=7868 RepID=V9KT15_CALMI
MLTTRFYGSSAPSGGQFFQSPPLDICGKTAPSAQNELCWKVDCFVPDACDPNAHLNRRYPRQGDGIIESMDTSMEHYGYNPVVNGIRASAGHYEFTKQQRYELRSRRKHKREKEDEGAPARKKRLTEKMLNCRVEPVNVLRNSWPHPPCCQESGLNANSWQVRPTPQEPRVIEKESVSMEVKIDTKQEELDGLQKLREIEDRLTGEDDPDVDGNEISETPILVLSDSLREELNRGLEEVLPRKIIESLNRPCMELVLWKPRDEHFSEKLETERKKQRHVQCDPSLYRTSTRLDSPLMSSNLNLSNTPEEDMEL